MVTTSPSHDPSPTLATKPEIPETDKTDLYVIESESTLIEQASQQLLNFNEIICKLQATNETTESALKDENKRLTDDISILTTKLSSVKEQRNSARQQLKEAQRRHESEITELREQNVKLENEMKRLEQYGAFRDVVKLLKRYEEMEERMVENEKQMLQYHDKLEESNEDLNGVRVQLTENGRNVKEQMVRCGEMEERIAGSEKKLREQEGGLEEAREGLVGVNTKLNELDSAVLPEKPNEGGFFCRMTVGNPSHDCRYMERRHLLWV
jgi:chromosome segregation ATPase